MNGLPQVHREVERKVRIGPDQDLPEFIGIGGIAAVQPGGSFQMAAIYHDTPDARLLRWGTTLRRREGGSDEGWHLKLPVWGADAGTRDEIHMPLWAGSTGFVPAELADIVAPLARGERLVPMAQVFTTRRPRILLDATGRPLAELVDDQVTVCSGTGMTLATFREIEVEALDAEDEDALEALAAVVEALIDAGAEPSNLSKAASALGHLASAPPDVDVPPMPGRKELATDAIRAAIAKQARHLILADVAVRRQMPDSVHQLRVAARRLRSILRTFEPLVDREWARFLQDELRWLADEMGAIRDTEVMMANLAEHTAELTEPDAARARAAIEASLGQRLMGARGSALAALRSERHDLLLDDLISAARAPKFTPDAYLPCEVVLPRLARRAWHRLVKRAADIDVTDDSAAWHRLRITAKRARYATDAMAPILGDGSERLGRKLASITEILGEHQDASIAQQAVREIALRPDVDGGQAFALGRLHEFERERQLSSRLAFADAWPPVRRAIKHLGST